ncbi:MAG: 16S rRNA (guanine(966)-N(2))-methyltransferase RsmD [Candidatus Planktophila sp.]|uniref:Methyltransferase n=1 Tax=freshwater metagenome TaxID=449393 RepID=A0A094PNX4_9ZZZZ|nr:16S rRNA (guanine(966)-N(2))-methyltransferase RsmD [Candidatus Planktophila sp.]
MRIIAGVARGRTLGSVAGATRPTSDRAREGLFSSLTSEFGSFEGVHVLDLFGGSGAIALESLSRGATLVHVVEKDDEAQKTIETNYELVKKSNPPGKFQLFGMSAERFLKDLPKAKYHLVYIDPPYDFSNQAVEDVLSALHDGEFLSSDAFIAVERTARGAQFIWPDAFSPARERNYGQATIYYANFQSENG